MSEPGRQAHWRKVYKEKGEKQVSGSRRNLLCPWS